MNAQSDLPLLLVTLMSGLLSGLVVAVVQWIVAERRSIREAKITAIADLMAYRFVLSGEPHVPDDISRFTAALNRIPIIFYYNRDLLSVYRDLKNDFKADKFSKFIRLLLAEAGVRQNQIDDTIIEMPLVVYPKKKEIPSH